MTMIQFANKGISLLLILVYCSGCTNILPERSSKAVVRIKTEQNLNPDRQGRASPIVLYIYQLKSDDAFNSAPFFELYENPSNILGQDLLGQQEIEISPNEKLALDKIKLENETSHLGFLAAYRNLDNAIWRATAAIAPSKTNYVEVSLGKLSIAAKLGKKRGDFLN